MLSYLTAAAIFAGSIIAPVSGTIALLILMIFDIRHVQVKRRERIAVIMRKFKNKTTTTIDDSIPTGLFYGKWYVGYIYSCSDSEYGPNGYEASIIAPKRLIDKITKDGDEESAKDDEIKENTAADVEDKTDIKVWCLASGGYRWCSYESCDLSFHTHPRPQQKVIIDNIIDIFYSPKRTRRNCVAYVSGEPGCGKSMLGLLVAAALKGHYTKDWNPLCPGNFFAPVRNEVGPILKMPLVVVLEEVDTMLLTLHEGRVQKHKDIRTPIHDKTTWNSFWDDVAIGMYPFIVFILTSNRDISWINELDPSYLRPGRVDLYSTLLEEED